MNKNILPAIPLLTSIALASFIYGSNTKPLSENFVATSDGQELGRKVDSIHKNLLMIKSEAGEKNTQLTNFLATVLQAYNWLGDQKVNDSYFFLHSVIESLSISDITERNESLTMLLDAELARFKQGDFSFSEDKAWVRIMQDLKTSAKKMMDSEIKNQISFKNQVASVDSLSREFIALKTLTEAVAIKRSTPMEKNGDYSSELFILLIGMVGSLVAFISRKKSVPEASSMVSAKPIEKFNYFEAKTNPETGVNLEEVCRNSFTNLSHMIKVSDLQITNKRKLPSTDRLVIQNDVINEAVDSLLKGTIVLAQNHKTDENISLEWNYDINSQRAMIELQLNGKEYTIDDLQRNHQLLQDASIASQFAHTQNRLANYRPVIQVLPKDGSTKITLSLDTKATDSIAFH
jgi:hypothetical protein